MERIKAGVKEFALAFLVFAGLLVLCAFYRFGIDLIPELHQVTKTAKLVIK